MTEKTTSKTNRPASKWMTQQFEAAAKDLGKTPQELAEMIIKDLAS